MKTRLLHHLIVSYGLTAVVALALDLGAVPTVAMVWIGGALVAFALAILVAALAPRVAHEAGSHVRGVGGAPGDASALALSQWEADCIAERAPKTPPRLVGGLKASGLRAGASVVEE